MPSPIDLMASQTEEAVERDKAERRARRQQRKEERARRKAEGEGAATGGAGAGEGKEGVSAALPHMCGRCVST